MASQPSQDKMDQNENKTSVQEKTETNSKMPPNFHQLLLNRNKKPLAAKNAVSQVPSTPSNIKRLQVNKWFNSPTDNMFSPCTKKLYKKTEPIQSFNLAEQINDSNDPDPMEQDDDQK